MTTIETPTTTSAATDDAQRRILNRLKRARGQLNAVIDASFAYEALSNVTADHQEAVNAFREKRAPRFTGR